MSFGALPAFHSGAITEDAIRAFLTRTHAESARAPIIGPNQYGAFPGSWFSGLLQGEALLIVPDTMVLLKDIGRACTRAGRTTLITAANSGALRLVCAQHVLDEVLRHSEERAAFYKVPHEVYLARWSDEYLPLIRTVRDDELSLRLLAPSEVVRVKALGASRDVPSVILSLVLGAFYVTLDRAARYAVYAEDADNEDLLNWLRVLMDGSNASEMGKMLFVVLAVPSLAASGLFHGIRSLAKKHPWVLAAIAGGIGLLAFRTAPETYRKIGNGLLFALSLLADLYRPYSEALDRFRKMAPEIPTWWELSQTNERGSVLARACLHTLARSPRSFISAQELAGALPTLGVGKDAQLVRETLRSHCCFAQPYRGRWQVGHPVRIPSRMV